MKYKYKSRYFTDVVVIGGGMAAMLAAIESYNNNVKTMIISKKTIGKSGASVMAKSVHRFSPDNSKLMNEYKEKILSAGRNINDKKLVDVLINKGKESVINLEKYGVDFNYKTTKYNGKKHVNFASCDPKEGKYLTAPVSNYLRNKSIEIFDNYMVVNFIKKDNKVCGVKAEKNNELILINCKAIVLATGGAGNIYKHNSGSGDLTGDGYAMAKRAGAILRDMEFVQFYPYRICKPKIHDIFPGIFSHGAVLLNENNERFMSKYPKKELENRDILSRQMFLQDKIYLSLERCNKNYLKKECNKLYHMYNEYNDTLFELKPVAHFFMGGIAIDREGTTNVQGLFSCGEVASGLHGANRLAGYALTEIAVFAPIAGENAAIYSKNNNLQENETYLHWIPELGNDNIKIFRDKLRNIMWENVGIIKNEEKLKKARKDINELKSEIKKLNPNNLRKWIETYNMIETASMVTNFAYKRKESRGAHYLDDYPNESKKWRGNICTRNNDIYFQNVGINFKEP
ncbi:MAG: FAD-binding protein [Bacillota bacterium]